MKKIKIPILTITLLTSLFFLSCSKDDEGFTIEEETSNVGELNLSKDQLAQEFAKQLAVLMSDQNTRQFVKTEVLKQFDGDYNALVVEVLKKELTIKNQSKSFGDHLSIKSAKNTSSIHDLISAIEDTYPLLQIAAPTQGKISIEEWETKEFVPLVAYIPSDLSHNIIPAFNTNGDYIELRADEAPGQLVIVLSENERVAVIDESEQDSKSFCSSVTPYFKSTTKNYFLKEKILECTGSLLKLEPSNPTSKSSGCDRDRKTDKDRLNRMKFVSDNAFKKVNEWFDGGQEIEVTITFGKANGEISTLTKTFYGRDRDFKNSRWFALGNTEIVDWDESLYGDAMLYHWVEKDPGNPLEINLGFSSKFKLLGNSVAVNLGFKKTITNEDDPLGQSLVSFCDNTDGAGALYNTGTIQFQVRQDEYSLVYEDEYLVGDWNGDGKDNIAVRRSNQILFDYDFDNVIDHSFFYGLGNDEDEYLTGDWNGDGKDNIAVRRGNHIIMDYNFDGIADRSFYYGIGNQEDEYIVIDWDGDGKDNIAVRRDNGIIIDFNFDGIVDNIQYFGIGNQEDEYLISDRDGDGKDNIGVRKGNNLTTHKPNNMSEYYSDSFGLGNTEDQYLIGDWDGDGKDNLAVRRGNQIIMDYDFDNTPDFTFEFGQGTN